MSANDMSERVDFREVLTASAKRLRLGVAGPKNADQLERIAVAVAELAVAANFAADWITEAGIRHRDIPNSATLARLTAALAPFNTP